jgi:diguanylate cyclase (GGDEF)-like protein
MSSSLGKRLRIAVTRRGNPLEWYTVDKGILVCLVMVPMLLSYVLYWHMALDHTTDGELFVFSEVEKHLQLLWTVVFAGLATCLLGLLIRRHSPDSTLFKHLSVQVYAIGMSLVGYRIGSLSVVVGVVLTGSPMIYYILFDRGAVLGAIASAALIIFGSAFASAAGWIDYAPVLANDAGGGEHSLFWVSSMLLLFVVPQMVVLFAIGAYVVRQWRRREQEVKRLSIQDPLTGIANRRHILDELDRELARAHREGSDFALFMMDLDDFKKINDRHGHPTGDKALVTATEIIGRTLRRADRIGRYGGEEFLVLLPGSDIQAALEVAERCRARLNETEVVTNGKTLSLSASFGVSAFRGGEQQPTAQTMIHDADAALYRAKKGGRNQVASAC